MVLSARTIVYFLSTVMVFVGFKVTKSRKQFALSKVMLIMFFGSLFNSVSYLGRSLPSNSPATKSALSLLNDIGALLCVVSGVYLLYTQSRSAKAKTIGDANLQEPRAEPQTLR